MKSNLKLNQSQNELYVTTKVSNKQNYQNIKLKFGKLFPWYGKMRVTPSEGFRSFITRISTILCKRY